VVTPYKYTIQYGTKCKKEIGKQGYLKSGLRLKMEDEIPIAETIF